MLVGIWALMKTCLWNTARPGRWSESKSRSVMSDSLQLHGLYSPWNSPGQNSGVGSLSLLQGIFPTQGLNNKGSFEVKVAQLCPTHCNPMVYTIHGILQARIVEWVAFPFYRGSSQPKDWIQVSHIAEGFFTSWATREALGISKLGIETRSKRCLKDS